MEAVVLIFLNIGWSSHDLHTAARRAFCKKNAKIVKKIQKQ
jgi:hypothetical protein